MEKLPECSWTSNIPPGSIGKGWLFITFRVLGLTTLGLRDTFKGQTTIYLCRGPDCRHAGPLHCQAYAAMDADALVDLDAYGGFTAWRCRVLLARGANIARCVIQRGLKWCCCSRRTRARVDTGRSRPYGTKASSDHLTRSPSLRVNSATRLNCRGTPSPRKRGVS